MQYGTSHIRYERKKHVYYAANDYFFTNYRCRRAIQRLKEAHHKQNIL